MRVLIACEFSGIVREAFTRHGHEAWSIDLLPSEQPGQHIQGDVVEFLKRPWLTSRWDLMIAFPPCTYLARSGARWWGDPERQRQQEAAIDFVRLLAGGAYVPRVAIENPIGKLSTAFRKPDQIIQPWQFGHGEVKATCLWLRGLPPLVPTKIVAERRPRVHMAPDSKGRWKARSRTLPGIAEAMADQWGSLPKLNGADRP